MYPVGFVYADLPAWTGSRSAPTKRCKMFIKRKRGCVEHSVLMTQVLQLWQLRRSFFVLFEEFSKHVEIGINTCLMQNMLDVTVTALALQNKREHPTEIRDLWKLCFLIIVIQYLPRISGWKDKHFRWRIIHFLPPRLLLSIWPYYFFVSITLIIADHCCCAMIL